MTENNEHLKYQMEQASIPSQGIDAAEFEIDRLRSELSSARERIASLEEDAKNGADWFNAFGEVESWMMERDWVSDGDMDKKSPAQTLINVLGKTEKALAAKDARIAELTEFYDAVIANVGSGETPYGYFAVQHSHGCPHEQGEMDSVTCTCGGDKLITRMRKAYAVLRARSTLEGKQDA